MLLVCFLPRAGEGRIFIDINSPSVQKIKIAIPDFRDASQSREQPDLVASLPAVISNDLDLSGYFVPMDKAAFLEENKAAFTVDEIKFRDWSTIGADLLLKGSYTSIGQSVEAEVRLFDVFRGRQILGKRILGRVEENRALMHAALFSAPAASVDTQRTSPVDRSLTKISQVLSESPGIRLLATLSNTT